MFAYGKVFSSFNEEKIRFTITKEQIEEIFKGKHDYILAYSVASCVTEDAIRDEFGSLERLVKLAQRNTHLIVDDEDCLIVLAADRKTAKKEYKRYRRSWY